MKFIARLTTIALSASVIAPAFAQTSVRIESATVSNDKDSIEVYLSVTIPQGFIQVERYGSGPGYDYSSYQVRADNQSKLIIPDLQKHFTETGTRGTQTMTLRACVEDPNANDDSNSCGPVYPLTIELGSSGNFSDVPTNHRYADAIRFVQSQGIVSGYPDGTYHPDDYINRAEFTKIVTLATYGQQMVNQCQSSVRFSDVVPTEWYVPYICRAQDSHLISGYPDGTFHPGNSINFVEAAKIIALADVERKNEPAIAAGNPWYEPYVRYLRTYQAIPITILNDAQPITRGEMAHIIFKLRTDTDGTNTLEN